MKTRHNFYIGINMDRYGDSVLKYVYKLDYDTKMAYWGTFKEMKEKGVKPVKMTRSVAEQYAVCLRWNGYDAFVIMTQEDLEV